MGSDTSGAGHLFNLDGKVALITGATRGIGLAIARAMASAGARVVISSNEASVCDEVAETLNAEGMDAMGVACDVSSKEQLQRLVDRVMASFGQVDILVCNAGVAPHMGPMASVSDEDWDLTMNINLRSIHYLSSLLIPQMAQRKDGAIIITSSISSVRGNKAIGLYGLSKAASAQLARNLAVEWGPHNIRVNAISPGLIDTQFGAPIQSNAELLARRLSLTPLRRVGTPDEIAGVAVMLAAPAGAFITGQNLIVDGGTTISDGN
ncbi:MAG: SDR family oxidoreductase [Spongiibacteraceae bacterium]|nr:SDR family oxidoreductase [Spongiibacteraceae bacterium]